MIFKHLAVRLRTAFCLILLSCFTPPQKKIYILLIFRLTFNSWSPFFDEFVTSLEETSPSLIREKVLNTQVPFLKNVKIIFSERYILHDDMKYIKYFKLYHSSLGAIQQVSTVVISFPSNCGNMQAYILSLIIRFISI